MTKNYDLVSVDDDDDLYILLELALREQPVALRRARTGAEALAQLNAAKPDLLLLDITLPDMRGWEVLDQATAANLLDGVPVIVLTSHTEVPHRIIGKVQEVAAYINKPFRASELRDTIGQILGFGD
jgi:DNA-binding response OmpR family regulator